MLLASGSSRDPPDRDSSFAAASIAYVGDRLDNDVLPAKAAGMHSVFIRRGPWGVIHGASAEAAQADLRIETLEGLAEALRRID